MNMQNSASPAGRTSETNAAVQTAGRELLTAVLQRNPLVAVAAALIGPVLGLFKRRAPATPTQIEKIKLERYRSCPVPPPATPPGPARTARVYPKVPRTSGQGNPKAARSALEAHPKPARSAFEAASKATRSGRLNSFAGANLNHGGPSHG